MWAEIAIAIATIAVSSPNAGEPSRAAGEPAPPRIEWRDSTAVGTPEAGSLRSRRAAAGRRAGPSSPGTRCSGASPTATGGAGAPTSSSATSLGVLRAFARAHPRAPRIGIGDLSLPEGGYFGPEVGGGIGHATHQNGLDVDVYYPRLDRRERPPRVPEQVDVELAQDLVDRFLAAGATTIYVGPNLPLRGPAGVVIPLVNHDNHLHARIAP